MNDEPRYTLDEAKTEIARQRCRDEGHDLDMTSISTCEERGVPISIDCLRCHKHWTVTPA